MMEGLERDILSMYIHTINVHTYYDYYDLSDATSVAVCYWGLHAFITAVVVLLLCEFKITNVSCSTMYIGVSIVPHM